MCQRPRSSSRKRTVKEKTPPLIALPVVRQVRFRKICSRMDFSRNGQLETEKWGSRDLPKRRVRERDENGERPKSVMRRSVAQ